MADRFEPDLINWVCARTQVDPVQVDLTKYARSRTVSRHRQAVLIHLGYQGFDKTQSQLLLMEALQLAHLQTRPALVLDALTGYWQEHRIEIPPYISGTVNCRGLQTFKYERHQ